MQNFFDQFDGAPAPASAPAAPGFIPGRPKQMTPEQAAAERRAEDAAARAAAADARAGRAEQRSEAIFNETRSGRPLSQTDYDKAKGEISQYTTLKTAFDTFKDDYAGNLAGGIENTAQAYLDVGTPGQRDWWAQFKAADNQIRNDLFGSALTAPEKAAYEATTVSPGMDPKQVKINLAKRADIIRQAVARRKEFYTANGFKADAVNAIFGGIDLDSPITTEEPPAAGADADLAAKYPDAAKFHYSKGELVGYEDSEGEFVLLFDGDGGGGGGGPSVTDSLYAGVGDIAQGAGDLLGVVANPLNAGINAVAGTELSTDLGQTFRDATGAPDGNQFASAINRGGISALTGAGAGMLARNAGGVTGMVGNALASQPVQQVVGGASAGASADLARQAGAPAPVQALAGIAGGVTGFSGANALMRGNQAATQAPAASNALLQDAQRAKIPVMTTDVIPPRTAIGKTARKTGELIPVAGTGGPRVKQQEARVNAVKALARDFDVDEASIDDVAKDLTAERTKQITFFKGQKDRVLENITQPAPATRAIAMLDQQIAAANKVKTAGSQALVSKLNDFKKALQSGGNTLQELEAIRKEMGTAFKDPSLANIADAGTKAVRSVYGPLRDDMMATIKEVGGDEAAKSWRVANARLSSMADELQSTALKSTLNKADSTPEDVAKLLFSTKPSQVRLLYNNLSSEGRVKAQGVLIAKALEKSGDSPDRFANEIDRLSKNVGVFFQDADLARVNGLNRVLQATKRAGQAGVQPDNGAQIVPWAIPTAVTSIFSPMSGAAAGGTAITAGLLARLYESAGVRNALLKLGRTKPGSPQERSMVPTVMAAIVAANDNPRIVQYLKDAPGLSSAAASEEVGEERPIQP